VLATGECAAELGCIGLSRIEFGLGYGLDARSKALAVFNGSREEGGCIRELGFAADSGGNNTIPGFNIETSTSLFAPIDTAFIPGGTG